MSRDDQMKPMYKTIYESLTQEIISGKYPPGSRLPSEKELTISFEVSRITSRKALDMLAEEGLIQRQPGKGSFVLNPAVTGRTKTDIVSGTGKKQMIGVITAGFAEPFGVKLIQGIMRVCEEYGVGMLLSSTHDNAEREQKAVSDMLSHGVDGLIIDPAHGEYYSPAFLKLVADNFPLVFVDRYLKGLKASFIGTDNISASYDLTHYLFELGHDCIGFVSFTPQGTSAIEERWEGFSRCHADRAIILEPSRQLTTLFSNLEAYTGKEYMESDIDKIQYYLEQNPSMTAIVADETNACLLVIEAAKRCGRRVPEDLSVVTFDCYVDMTGYVKLTHMKQNELEMGKRAAQILLDRIAGNNDIEQVLLPAQLIEGHSSREKPEIPEE